MLERLTSATFVPLTGDVFHVTPISGGPIELVLTECQESRYRPDDPGREDAGRAPFSLVFHAPDSTLFEQQTCTIEHPRLGVFPLFLVPLGPDDRGMGYEAVIA